MKSSVESVLVILEKHISGDRNEFSIEFIRWFHEFSVTMNLQFQETEFVYLFLFTVNVNSNIHFRWKNL